LVLNSNFPISLAWGAQHTQIYNDGYWSICGDKHPDAMGQDFSECWASAFPVIGDAFYLALSGETAFLEDQRMFLDRLGYLEEAFFTFSFSPIRDETGKVAGLFHPVPETTSKMVGQRRTRTLRDLSVSAAKGQSLTEAFTLAVETLANSNLDLPFVTIYLLDETGKTAQLVSATGLAAGTAASPEAMAVDDRGWNFEKVVMKGETLLLEDLSARFPELICEPYPEPVHTALVLPLLPPGADRPAALMVVGASARLPMNEASRSFFDFSKIEAGKIELEMQAFSLRECIESAMDLLSTVANTKGVGLGYLMQAGTIEGLFGDVGRLRQVLVNLLSNAVKFSIETEKAALQSNVTQIAPIPLLKGLRVLMVDDLEINNRRILHHLQVWGMTAYACASSTEAIEWIERGDPFDLALLDYHMPDINGVMLARSLRQQRSSQELPIILLSSMIVDTSKEEGIISNTMLKPIKPHKLLAAIPVTAEALVAALSRCESIEPSREFPSKLL
jgi:CheY-like chemotaxis protein